MHSLHIVFTFSSLIVLASSVLISKHGQQRPAANEDEVLPNNASDSETVETLADLFQRKQDSYQYMRVRPGVNFVGVTHAFAHNEDVEPRTLAASHSIPARSKEDFQGTARIAHCLAGAARTLDSPLMYENYLAHAIRPVEARHDLFFAIEDTAGEDKKYNSAFKALQPRAVAYVLHGYQYDKWRACALLIEAAEKADQREYDFVIKARPDLVVLTDLPPISTFPSSSVWLRPYFEQVTEMPQDFEDGTHTWYKAFLEEQARDPTAGFCDLMIVMPRSAASTVLRVWDYKNKETDKTCGNRQECLVKVMIRDNAFPVEFRPFQVRILRQHGEDDCFLDALDKKYNSICI